jgi:hypothetical protein
MSWKCQHETLFKRWEHRLSAAMYTKDECRNLCSIFNICVGNPLWGKLSMWQSGLLYWRYQIETWRQILGLDGAGYIKLWSIQLWWPKSTTRRWESAENLHETVSSFCVILEFPWIMVCWVTFQLDIQIYFTNLTRYNFASKTRTFATLQQNTEFDLETLQITLMSWKCQHETTKSFSNSTTNHNLCEKILL